MRSAARSVRLLGLAATATAVATTLAACSSSSSSSSASTSTSPVVSGSASANASGSATANADALVAAAYKGTFTAPPATGPKAATGKNVWVISCGEVLTSCSGLADPAMAAGKAAGWTMHLYDAKLNPANYTTGIDQAVANGANGIITVAVDCSLAKSALTQAKTAGIKTVGLVSFDCNDPLANTGPALYSTFVKYSGLATAGDAIQQWRGIAAAWLIKQTQGKAKIMETSTPGFLISEHEVKGFADEVKTCSSCSIANSLTISPTEGLSGAATTKMESALVRSPEVNAVDVANDGYFTQFANAALKSAGSSSRKVMGGECVDAAAMNAIRAGGPEQACVAQSVEWESWGAVDELNRQFVSPGSAPVDEGLGFQLVDKDHNLPASGVWTSPVQYKAAYMKVWTGK